MVEAKLIDLLATSKEALQVGEALASQATAAIERGQHDMDEIERLWPLLQFLATETEAQLQVFETVESFLRAERLELDEYYQEKQGDIQQIEAKLSKTFTLLQETVVEAGIHQLYNQFEGSDDKAQLQRTLFDYVDDQSVLDLQNSIRVQLVAIEGFCSRFASHLNALHSEVSDLSQSRSSLLSIDFGSAFDFVAEKRTTQQSEMGGIAEMLIDLTHHYDQISLAIKHAESDPNLDISVLEQDTEDLNIIESKLEESLEVIKTTCSDLHIRVQQIAATYADLVRLFSSLADLGLGPLDDLLSATRAILTDQSSAKPQLEIYLKEAWNLLAWYNEFRMAYDQLIIEIDRRKASREQAERLVQEYKRELDNLHDEEIRKRAEWFEASGIYIPQDLCPGILDSPIQFEIRVSEEFNDQGPSVTEAAVRKARANILATEMASFS